MKCVSCGARIKGDPVWVDNDPYCSEKCADMGSLDEEDTESEEDEEEK